MRIKNGDLVEYRKGVKGGPVQIIPAKVLKILAYCNEALIEPLPLPNRVLAKKRVKLENLSLSKG